MAHLSWRSLILGALLVSGGTLVNAKENEQNSKEKKEEKTLVSQLDGKIHHAGFVDIYRDEKNGTGLLVLTDEQLNKPFLYFATTVNGAVDAGHFEGAYRQSRLIEFRKYFDRIDIIAKTPRYFFDPQNPISRAKDANISEAVLVSAKIDSQGDGKYAIKLADVFKNESLHRIAPLPNPDKEKEKKRFKLGKFAKDKSRIVGINNFPQNTHVVVDYVYNNATPKVRGGREISDPRSVSIKLQHAFIQLPETDFVARRDDARVGYFTQQFDDLTSEQATNYRDVINRWDLTKKDPTAAVSDPVQPIVWWIENTTPYEWRDTIRDATLAWNSAFEKAGISNAIEVKVQPDDAKWTADDVRYNVLRWTSSPRPPFGGYGPSIANPFTGQIIAADIMLEFNFMKGRWITAKMFTDGIDALEPEFDLESHDGLHCSLGHGLSANLLFGHTAALAKGMDSLDKDKMLRQSMYYLILHEVGHTLGLNHNMRATQLHDHKSAHDDQQTQGILAGSVMDYPSINFAPEGTEQGDFYTEKPGPYDDWVIEYGYSQSLGDAAAEEDRLETILSRSMQPELAFGNDADDMRAAGRHIDPRVNIFDMSSDAVAYGQDRFALIRSTAKELKEKVLGEGRSHHDLLVGVNVLMNEMTRQSDVASRYIGGVYVERALVGQQGYKKPYTPVPADLQKQAMNSLRDNLFAPDAVAHLQPLFAYIQPQRRSFERFGRNEDPKLHAMLLTTQKRVLNHLLHKNVLQRISDSALYGNEYSLEAMVTDLTNAVFSADRKSNVNGFRRNLQTEYINRLIKIAGLEKPSNYDNMAQASALYELERIQDEFLRSSRGDQGTKVHRNFLNKRINSAFHKAKA